MSRQSNETTGYSLPVLALTALGVLITVLGLFAAGDMAIVAVGLAAVFGAGVIGVVERLIDRGKVQSNVEDETTEA